jgi:hypothetical protein
MNRTQRAVFLPALFLAWALLPPAAFSQTAESKGWATRLIGEVHGVQSALYRPTIPLAVKNQQIFFVRNQVLSDDEQIPAGRIAAEMVRRTPSIEVSGSEELLEALLQEAPGQRVLELRGVYDPEARVLHLNTLQPVEAYPPSYPGCPPLPVKGPADQVSVLVAKAQTQPGFVCVRVVNGLREVIAGGAMFGKLQQWEEGTWWRAGQFCHYKPDTGVAVLAVRLGLPPRARKDEYLPLSRRPTPPGRYRACFRFSVFGQTVQEEECSEEFSLP